jgi:hypothetical protein
MDRAGFKWTVNEILSLQREFELLGWTIDQIALKHKRTPNAIMYKLDQEGFADYNVLYSNYHDLNAKIPIKNTTNLQLKYDYDSEIDDSVIDDDKNDEDYVDNSNSEEEDEEEEEDEDEEDYDYQTEEMKNLSERVYNLETVVYEIQIMVNQLMSKNSNTSKKCLSKSLF